MTTRTATLVAAALLAGLTLSACRHGRLGHDSDYPHDGHGDHGHHGDDHDHDHGGGYGH